MAQSWYTSPARAPVESIFDPPGVSERGDTVAAVAAAVGGLIAGVGLRTGWGSRGFALVVPGVLVALAGSGRVRQAWTWVLGGIAGGLSVLLLWHPDGAVAITTFCVAVLLSALAAVLARSSGPQLGALDAVRRCVVLCGDVIVGPLLFVQAVGVASGEVASTTAYAPSGPWSTPQRPAPEPGNRSSLLRGVLLAVPCVAILWWVLASGDALIDASWIDLSPGSLALTVVCVALGAWVAAGFVRTAGRAFVPFGWTAMAERIGRPHKEAAVVTGAVAAVLLVFGLLQTVGLIGGIDDALADAGQTRADNARSALLQVIVAAAVVWWLAALTRWLGLSQKGSPPAARITASAALVAVAFLAVLAFVRTALAADESGWDSSWVLRALLLVWIALMSLYMVAAFVGSNGVFGHGPWLVVLGACGLAALVLAAHVIPAGDVRPCAAGSGSVGVGRSSCGEPGGVADG